MPRKISPHISFITDAAFKYNAFKTMIYLHFFVKRLHMK